MKKIIFFIATMSSISAFSQVENMTSNKTKVGLYAEIMTGDKLRLKTNNNFKFNPNYALENSKGKVI